MNKGYSLATDEDEQDENYGDDDFVPSDLAEEE